MSRTLKKSLKNMTLSNTVILVLESVYQNFDTYIIYTHVIVIWLFV